MMMSRRALLGASALVLPFGLAACQESLTTVPSTAVTDLNLMSQALTAQLPLLQADGVDAATIAKVQAQVTAIAGQVATVTITMLEAEAQPVVNQVATDVGAVETALGNITLPAAVQKVIAAVEALIPVVQVAVGIAVAAGAQTMAPEDARQVLRAATS